MFSLAMLAFRCWHSDHIQSPSTIPPTYLLPFAGNKLFFHCWACMFPAGCEEEPAANQTSILAEKPPVMASWHGRGNSNREKSHLDKARGVSRDNRNAAIVCGQHPCMALLQPFCPSPKAEVQEGLVRQDGWLLGTGFTTLHKNRSLLPYFQCTRPSFPSLWMGPAPFEDKTSFPAPRSPSSPFSYRTEQHPACPKSRAYCHSPFSPFGSS